MGINSVSASQGFRTLSERLNAISANSGSYLPGTWARVDLREGVVDLEGIVGPNGGFDPVGVRMDSTDTVFLRGAVLIDPALFVAALEPDGQVDGMAPGGTYIMDLPELFTPPKPRFPVQSAGFILTDGGVFNISTALQIQPDGSCYVSIGTLHGEREMIDVLEDVAQVSITLTGQYQIL